MPSKLVKITIPSALVVSLLQRNWGFVVRPNGRTEWSLPLGAILAFDPVPDEWQLWQWGTGE